MNHHPDGPSPDRGPAPAFPNHDFSPAAILSRARAYAAERAAELAARPPRADGRSGAEVLAAIEAELSRAEILADDGDGLAEDAERVIGGPRA